jgi:hypothetical protein
LKSSTSGVGNFAFPEHLADLSLLLRSWLLKTRASFDHIEVFQHEALEIREAKNKHHGIAECLRRFIARIAPSADFTPKNSPA